jgi:hypothetical protein
MTRTMGCRLGVLLLAPMVLGAQRAPAARVVPPAFAALSAPVAHELSGARARGTVAFVEQFFRLPGNRGFDAAIDTVAALLAAAGYVPEARATAADRLTYRVESRPMAAPAWTPEDATLTLEGRATPLLAFRTNRNLLAINSWPTPPEGVNAPLVDVGAATEADLAGRDLAGAIVLVDAPLRTAYPRVMQRGALGVLAVQRLPAYNRPDVNRTAIQFSSIPRDTVRRGFALFLPAAAQDSVRAALRAGPVRVRVVVRAAFEVRPERTVVAEIRGAQRPAERFVYSAHVQEPGANDNASGVGLLAEMARTAAVLVRRGAANPGRTLTFLWGDEIRSTDRYIKEDSVRRGGIRWGMSLDMVGEDTEKTGGTFLIEKMPDPSAVWVRGEDRHSEWGGRPIPASDIRPHWFNDFVRQRCLDRAAATGWVVKANPFEGGSDHTPFLTARIPAVLLWHFTDQHYHTDRDRLEMVSAATLANVGNCALSTGLLLTDGRAAVARSALDELTAVAVRTLGTQRALADSARAAGASAAEQRTILGAWRDYYVDALARVPEMAVDAAAAFAREVAAAQEAVRQAAARVLAGVEG